MSSTTLPYDNSTVIPSPPKPPAFQSDTRRGVGKILSLVVLAHLLVIALLLSYFGGLSGAIPDIDSSGGMTQSGTVIPVTLEAVVPAEQHVAPKPEQAPSESIKSSTSTTEDRSESSAKEETETTLEVERIPETALESPAPESSIMKPATQANSPKPASMQAPTKAPASSSTPKVASAINAPTSSGLTQTSNEQESLRIIPAQVDPDYLHRPNPVYPALSRRLREEGTVVLRVSLDAQGSVQDIAIEKSSDFRRLDQAARDAVRQWRFIPARRGQQTIPSTALVPIEFKHQ